MADGCAYIDESIRVQGDGEPTYYICATIIEMAEEDVRSLLWPIVKGKATKLHWSKMTRTERRKSMEVISRLPTVNVVVMALPLTSKRSERARRLCLKEILPVLENRYGVVRVVFESRTAAQDRRDLDMVNAMKSQKLLGKQMTAAFTRGADDARVWIPDQILGALGDQHHARVKNFKDFLGKCDTHIVALDC